YSDKSLTLNGLNESSKTTQIRLCNGVVQVLKTDGVWYVYGPGGTCCTLLPPTCPVHPPPTLTSSSTTPTTITPPPPPPPPPTTHSIAHHLSTAPTSTSSLSSHYVNRYLHSFPTRRSSDLVFG